MLKLFQKVDDKIMNTKIGKLADNLFKVQPSKREKKEIIEYFDKYYHKKQDEEK